MNDAAFHDKTIPMIEVFKTNVQETRQAEMLASSLLIRFPGLRINFDLDDCDKVLRVEGCDFHAGEVITIVHEHGFSCHILE